MDATTMFAPLSSNEAMTAEQTAPKANCKTPIVPVPDDAPPMTFKHPKFGEPSKSWPYRNADCDLVGYVCRWDFLDSEGRPAKEFFPVTYCDIGNGRRAWRSKGMPAPRPLFNLPFMVDVTEGTVLVVEGEKTRDAAAELFPDMLATTPAHGAKSPHLTDFSPLAGRDVIIATDNDKAGQEYGDKVCELLRAAGAASIRHLPPDRLGAWRWQDGEKVLRGEPIPEGWDLADALDEGWTAERVAELHDDPAFLPPYRDAAERKAAQSMLGDDADLDGPEAFEGWPFRLAWNGVEKRIERADKETGMITVEWRWFCSLLEVAAETRSSEGEEWGRLLSVTDRDQRTKEWAMPMAMLAGDGTAYRERLLSLGLIMAPGKFARDALHEYISTARPDTKARCVARVGWHSRSFTLSNQTVEPAHG
ncbi:DUF927 domain-containing protein [Ancylobacter sonchi]|uniref:DUF927 domain-containing protein n=1 Tax=Ancylobacter sonchi TaxID=1937790 RepID=UPI001BD56169|nr:DUF927 domain-containing protein [Ancylobacter sonchi]MBS7535003.1 DUF927 domain-containing protein [Ancylobacter sonchi]